jgi:hypothetical protein
LTEVWIERYAHAKEKKIEAYRISFQIKRAEQAEESKSGVGVWS